MSTDHVPYICLTYATADREEKERLCLALGRYGFHYFCVNELADHESRGQLLSNAALLVALTSPAAVPAETVAADIRRAMERGTEVLCVGIEACELEDRFCVGAGGSGDGRAALIPLPVGETPDGHTVALFVHRLFVRHLSRYGTCFDETRCTEDHYGHVVRHAVRARAGDRDACFALGAAYEQGGGLPTLENEAALWLSRAAEAGDPDARIRMGELFLLGKGVKRDPEGAFRLFSLAAEAGDLRGEYHCGLCYLEGYGVMKDPEQAVVHLERAARGWFAPALHRLALLFRDGEGVPRSSRTALALLRIACTLPVDGGALRLTAPARGEGDAPAEGEVLPPPPALFGRGKVSLRLVTMRQLRRGRLYARLSPEEGKEPHRLTHAFGRCRVSRVDLPEDAWLRELFSAAAEEETAPGSPRRSFSLCTWEKTHVAEAAATLARLLEEGDPAKSLMPHTTRARVWYRYALRLGHTEALFALGEMYRRGKGGPADPRRAAELFTVSAGQGEEKGRFALAVCYERGIGVPVDPRRAFHLYEQAAMDGYAPAQNNLGGCYEYGMGIPVNPIAAVEWYTRAARAGQPDAACRLGLCYEEGRGVEADPLRAFHLYETAAEQGHPYACYRLGLCYDRGIGPSPEMAATRSENLVLSEEDDAPVAAPAPRSESGGGIREEEGEGTIPVLSVDAARAAHLYGRAAEGGVADAAYALALCYRNGRGLPRDEENWIVYLRKATNEGHLQASYELGMCCLEGTGTVRDARMAQEYFDRAAVLWRGRVESERWEAGEATETLPVDALSAADAAGNAFYMRGYCTLYGIGEDSPRGVVTEALREGTPDPARVVAAAADLREAAELEHVGAVTALGDLYAYGLLPSGSASAADVSLEYYVRAARMAAQRKEAEHPTLCAFDSPVDALMSLASRSRAMAEECAAAGDVGGAEMAWVQVWRSFAACAEEGSVDALLGMARCTYFGRGTPENREASLWFLRRAREMGEGRVSASLWLGDDLRARGEWEAADDAYLRAVRTPTVESECGPYTLHMRRADRRRADEELRAEALYRLAILRAVHFHGDPLRGEAFPYLVRAALMGHAAAGEDLARMYDYEKNYAVATTSAAPRKERRKPENPLGTAHRLRRRMKRQRGLFATERDGRAVRSHEGWLTDYYTALWPEPMPFAFSMQSKAVPTDMPAYVTAPVTDGMRASLFNYLGDCLFFGQGLGKNTAAAVDCYRRVVGIRFPRGVEIPVGVTWATYSYGWCLLHGEGVAENPREAVEWLTRAAKTHAEAAYTLGECYEQGVGVDCPDYREAVKHFRKAVKLGYRPAEARARALEKLLNEEE